MNKDSQKTLTLRLSPEEWKKFKILCAERETSMHKYLYKYVVKSINQEDNFKRLQNG